MKKNIFLISLALIFLVVFTASPSSAFPANSIYVQQVTNAPIIDGKIDDGEWATEEEQFQETISGLSYSDGSQTDLKIDVVALKNDTFMFFLVKILTDITDGNGSISVGIAVGEGQIQLMSTAADRKVAYWNSTTTTIYDLHFDPTIAGGATPGAPDEIIDFYAMYGSDDTSKFFEFAMPITPTNTDQNVAFTESTNVAFVVNPYGNIVSGQVGHSAKASGKLQISFSPRGFFQRPAEGMDVLTMIFIGLFAILVSFVGLMFIMSGRNENIASKTWVINTTEKMAKASILQEIAFYNSNFLAMVLELFLIVYSIITLSYGIWAQWGNIGFAFTVPPLLISLFSFYDLGQRNENLQLKLMDERTKVGVDMTKSPKLWIIPTGFLALVLFMLVFIGIDVIT